jgi:hypothetical protein
VYNVARSILGVNCGVDGSLIKNRFIPTLIDVYETKPA